MPTFAKRRWGDDDDAREVAFFEQLKICLFDDLPVEQCLVEVRELGSREKKTIRATDLPAVMQVLNSAKVELKTGGHPITPPAVLQYPAVEPYGPVDLQSLSEGIASMQNEGKALFDQKFFLDASQVAVWMEELQTSASMMQQVIATALPPGNVEPTLPPKEGDNGQPGDTTSIAEPSQTIPVLPTPTSSSTTSISAPTNANPTDTESESEPTGDNNNEDENGSEDESEQETEAGEGSGTSSTQSDSLASSDTSTISSSTSSVEYSTAATSRASKSSDSSSPPSRSSSSLGDFSSAAEDANASSGATLGSSDEGGVSLPVIIGIAGGVALLLIGLLVLCSCIRKRRKKRMEEEAEAYEGIAWDEPESATGNDIHPEYYQQPQQRSAYQQPSSYASHPARTSIGSETFFDDKTAAPTRFAAQSPYAASIRTDGAEVQTQKAKSVAARSTLAPPTARSYAPSSRGSMNSTELYGPRRGGTSAVV